ncbi:DUF3794 domain-containing protein [Pontibacillus sp. HMF3514]|uniref:DUF3794 domain-containing protein n=1 Tax=Pontibacillus sp. HMF3514 TaxID=2692425 RepID=UPI00131F5926|nr:DUF3794 domain-containing protein [Pontibacillus sp. HMF3514]QHE54115.1 DUF3794 domain-containing protein [Pontibacillus sp. HMF3514]
MHHGEMILYTGITPHEEYPCNPTAYKQVILNSKIEIPCPKPDLEAIIKVVSEVELRTQRYIQTPYDFKVIVEGTVHQTFLYSADVPEQSVHTFHGQVPFCEFLTISNECKKAYLKQNLSTKVFLEDVFVFNQSSRYIEECKMLCIILLNNNC